MKDDNWKISKQEEKNNNSHDFMTRTALDFLC